MEPGGQLGPYRLVERIGQGGMGVVWKALDRRLDREVALKLLPEKVAHLPEYLERFEREARMVAALNHPNIVTLYSVEDHEGVPFITMELVRGKILSQLIPAAGFELERFLELAVPLADALGAAHERGVVHRDLKPGNVMVGADGRLKVLDFGLAKLRRQAKAPDDPSSLETRSELLTETGQVMGTAPYMSPEQLQGEELDARSDVFSLGIVLYEMATGGRPFRGDNSAQLITSILRDTPKPVAEIKTEFPNHVGRIIRRCLEKQPERRYGSGAEVRSDLDGLAREIQSGTGPLAAPPRRSRLPRWLPFVGAAILVVAATLLIVIRVGPGGPEASHRAVAVLPFDNLTGDPQRDYLCEGISAGLITRLSEVAGVRVASRAAAWRGADAEETPRALARRLGVGAVLDGAVQAEAGRLRVDLTLTLAESGLTLWSERFEASDGELFALQEEIARELTAVLSVPLSAKELRRLARDPTGSYRAYDTYLRAQQRLGILNDVDALAGAVELFRQATRLDDGFALAHAGLSEALWRTYLIDRDSTKLQLAETAARRALQLDGRLPAAHVALARVLRSTGRHAQSLDELRTALRDHPKPDEAQRELAASYAQVGDLEQAEAALRSAVALGERDWFNWNALGALLHQLGRYDEARDAFAKASALSPPGVGTPHENLAALTVLQGRFDEAIRAFDKLPRPIRDASLASNIGTAYYFSRHPARLTQAEEHYELAVRLDPRDPVLRRNLADLLIDLGRRDEALHHYREALRLVEERLDDNPASFDLKLQRTIYSARAERCPDALRLAGELAGELPRTANNLHLLAQPYALCERPAAAIAALAGALELGFPAAIVRQEAEFAALHEDPRFEALFEGAN